MIKESFRILLFILALFIPANGYSQIVQGASSKDIMTSHAQTDYDKVLRLMLNFKDKNQDDEAISIGLASIRTPKNYQIKYPYQYLIYTTLVVLMNRNFRFADVPEIANKGMYFVRQRLKPSDDRYFQLPVSEAVAWTLMCNTEKADSVYRWIDENTVVKSTELKKALASLRAQIDNYKSFGIAEQKQHALHEVENLQRKLLLVNPKTQRGSFFFHDYFNFIRHTLRLYYFDTSNASDERIWSRLVADMMLPFYIMCDSLPGRTVEAYNNTVTRKDFLAYHTGKYRKHPVDWQDIRDRLREGEAAIEFACLPEEALVIKKDSKQPESAAIDSLLFDQIVAGLEDEPVVIGNLYGPDGPLAKLWQLIEPSISGLKTLFVSGSNMFTQINYGTIPLSDGSTVANRYDVHVLLSTSEVCEKHNHKTPFKTAAVFGGIDYESSEHKGNSKFADEPWNLTRGLPYDVRNGFNYLPNSLVESKNVDSILSSNRIADKIYTKENATEEIIKSMDGNAPELLHISTHGFMLAPLYNSSDTIKADTTKARYKTVLSQSGLLLAGANKSWRDFKHDSHNDGILTSREIAQLDLSDCKLVVLSACKSALGDTRNLTGLPFGVAYALKLAGVKQVLCSLWSISDKATSVFMKSFYSHLMTTHNPRLSLRQAQKDMIAKGYKSPYYWASFVIIE